MKIYCVVQRYYDSGKVKANLEVTERDEKPENTSEELEKYDLYREYFTDAAEADAFYKSALKS